MVSHLVPFGPWRLQQDPKSGFDNLHPTRNYLWPFDTFLGFVLGKEVWLC